MQRAAMIESLTEATLDSILECGDLALLRALLKRGFTGFETLSTPRLIREMQLSGLLADDSHTEIHDGGVDPDAESCNGP